MHTPLTQSTPCRSSPRRYRHWYYEDFIREQNPAKFPSYTLKTFCEILFRTCPPLQHLANDHERAFNQFMQYKTRVPVCGAIMLNETWDKVRIGHDTFLRSR